MIHHKIEQHSHSVKWKAFLDKIIIWVCIIGPFTAIPQALEIWVQKKAAGVSITSWSLYIIFAAFWLFYGIVHKDKPIIINSFLWIVIDVLVVIGVLIYG